MSLANLTLWIALGTMGALVAVLLVASVWDVDPLKSLRCRKE